MSESGMRLAWRAWAMSVSGAVAALAPGNAWAQESTHTPAATQPAEGNWYLRQKVQYVRLGRDPSPADREIDKIVSTTMLTYGISRDVSLTLDVPVEFESSRSNATGELDRSFGVNDIGITAKWRPLQWDLGPVDSVRVAFTAGVEVPTFDGKFSSQGVDPSLGAVFTMILGRHGFNQSLRYKFTTDGQPYPTRAGDGDADALFYDSSYLFRISPEEYAAGTEASMYLTVELGGVYETNGDNEIVIGPGVLYEARTFAIEATLGWGVVRDADERPTPGFVASIGFRLLF